MLKEAIEDLMEVIGLYREEVPAQNVEELLEALEAESLGYLLEDAW